MAFTPIGAEPGRAAFIFLDLALDRRLPVARQRLELFLSKVMRALHRCLTSRI